MFDVPSFRVSRSGFRLTGGGGNGATSAFDPTQIGPQTVLTNSNRTATITILVAGMNRAYTLSGKAAGKWYSEFLITTRPAVGRRIVGLAVAGQSLTSGCGNGVDDYGYGMNAAGATVISTNGVQTPVAGITFASGDTIGIAVDFATGNIFYSVNNVYILSGNPVTQANPSDTIVNPGTYFADVSYGPNVAAMVYTAPSVQLYAPPAGFTAWS